MYSRRIKSALAYVRDVTVELLVSAGLFLAAALALVLVRPVALDVGVAPEAYGLVSAAVIVGVFVYVGLRGLPER